MRQVEFPATLTAKVDIRTREAVEEIAIEKGLSLGEVTRDILNAGMKALGVECQ